MKGTTATLQLSSGPPRTFTCSSGVYTGGRVMTGSGPKVGRGGLRDREGTPELDGRNGAERHKRSRKAAQ